MNSLLKRIGNGWNDFFFARCATKNALTYVGYIRIFYGLLLLYDRLILGLDFDLFFTSGLIPCQQSFHDLEPFAYESPHIDPSYPSSLLCTLADKYLPSDAASNYFYYLAWAFFYLGLLHIVLFTLGVAPKFQLLGIHVNLLSFHYYTPLLWDGEDVMIKVWNFLFLFLPLHYVTIYDWRREISRSEAEESWPLWPFRLFQLEVCFIYAGAGYAKLGTTVWRSGNALYHIIHEKDFFGGPFVPEFLFHRYGPLKLMTWASLFLECTGFFFVWFRSLRMAIVAAMILLHVGIDLTMNMHIFEWVSIIGWLMFFFESDRKETSSRVKLATETDGWYRRRWIISVFLLTVLTIFFIDTLPLLELYDSLVSLLHLDDKTTATSLLTKTDSTFSIPITVRAVNMLYYLNDWRHQYFVNPIARPLLYPIGLFQGVWNLYSGAPDTFCRYDILLSTYNSSDLGGDDSALKNIDDNVVVMFQSPDWGTFKWYQKKRWQRPMTMYEKLPEVMCRECFLQYHARQFMQHLNESISIGSLRLQVDCERPPPPPVVDDWFNWTGWFYANAKQDLLVPMETSPTSLYMLNICDDLLVECPKWSREGLCDSVNHRDRFTMTQSCRRSCRLCPEHGYDADQLFNGTRISIIWPVPAELIMFHTSEYADAEDVPLYYNATIVSIKNRPMKRYLLKYDDSFYNNEWFDPILLRERGYRLLKLASSPNTAGESAASVSSTRVDFPDPGGDEL